MAKLIQIPLAELTSNKNISDETKLFWKKIVFMKDVQTNIIAIRFYFDIPLRLEIGVEKEHLSGMSIPVDRYEESVQVLCERYFPNPDIWYKTMDRFIRHNKVTLPKSLKMVRDEEYISLNSNELKCLYSDEKFRLCIAEIDLHPSISAIEKDTTLALFIRKDATLDDIKEIYTNHIEKHKAIILKPNNVSLPLTESLDLVNDVVSMREPLVGNKLGFKEIAAEISIKYGKTYAYNDINNVYKRGKSWGF